MRKGYLFEFLNKTVFVYAIEKVKFGNQGKLMLAKPSTVLRWVVICYHRPETTGGAGQFARSHICIVWLRKMCIYNFILTITKIARIFILLKCLYQIMFNLYYSLLVFIVTLEYNLMNVLIYTSCYLLISWL